MRNLLALLVITIAACAPQDQPLGEEAGPQAGAAAVDVGVNAEALVACNDAGYCGALKTIVRSELNSRCGGGWSTLSGGCSSTWTATAPGGRTATVTRISTTQRYVTATQCSAFTQSCSCAPGGYVVCD